MNYDGLLNSQHAERFDLLIEGLQQWRSGFRMQHGARMRLERDYGRHSAGCARAFDYRLHNELMAEMQTVEHAQRHHGRTGDVGIIGSVEKTHKKVTRDE